MVTDDGPVQAVTAKYEPLRLALESAPDDEPVSFTFAELDELVGGLPASARDHRPWWANASGHHRPHALAWMSLGRRVSEVRLGEAVVFSPADAQAVVPGPTSSAPRRSGSPPILDGVSALAAVLERAGYETVLHAVAAHTVFLHPDTVDQSKGRALFRLTRDPTRRGAIDSLPDGRSVMYDDNTGPTLAFLWAAQRTKGRDVQFNHVWGDPKNPDTYTALWNLCATPAFLAKTTDGSNHPEVVSLLRYRAFDLFGRVPVGEEEPGPSVRVATSRSPGCPHQIPWTTWKPCFAATWPMRQGPGLRCRRGNWAGHSAMDRTRRSERVDSDSLIRVVAATPVPRDSRYRAMSGAVA